MRRINLHEHGFRLGRVIRLVEDVLRVVVEIDGRGTEYSRTWCQIISVYGVSVEGAWMLAAVV